MGPTFFFLMLRKLQRHPISYAKTAVAIWIACLFLIYNSSYLIGFSQSSSYQLSLVNPNDVPDAESTFKGIQSEIHNLPLYYLRTSDKESESSGDRECGYYPAVWELKFSNFYWQVLYGKQATFYLYSAYYDKRRVSQSISLRLLSMISKYNVTHFHLYCQIWFEGMKEPVVSVVQQFTHVWNPYFGNQVDGILQPYLLGCNIPETFSNLVPLSVSLSEEPCGKVYNNLRVTYNPPTHGQKKNIAVCVKTMNEMFSDNSVRLVEWLELLSILGADKVYMYVMGLHHNYTKVLDYYQARGFLDVRKTSFPGDKLIAPSIIPLYFPHKALTVFMNDLISLNDCFYRNLYRYKLVALLDTDEIFASNSSDSWISFLNNFAPEALSDEGSDVAMYVFENVFFLDGMQDGKGWAKDIPSYMHILQHVHRAPEHSGPWAYAKGFHNPNLVLSLHFHFPFACLNAGGCKFFSFHPKDAQMQHYVEYCPNELTFKCQIYQENAVLDTTVLKYKYKLTNNTIKSLKHLGYFKKGKSPQ